MHAVLVLALVAPTAAQPKEQPKPAPEGFGVTTQTELYWPFWVTASPDVQKELKLTKEQIKALDDVQDDLKKCIVELPLAAGPPKAQIAKVTCWSTVSPRSSRPTSRSGTGRFCGR